MENVANRYQPTNMEMVNKQNKRRSVLKFEKIQVRKDVPEEYFTPGYLERP
jgi:hypothetical protein